MHQHRIEQVERRFANLISRFAVLSVAFVEVTVPRGREDEVHGSDSGMEEGSKDFKHLLSLSPVSNLMEGILFCMAKKK